MRNGVRQDEAITTETCKLEEVWEREEEDVVVLVAGFVCGWKEKSE